MRSEVKEEEEEQEEEYRRVGVVAAVESKVGMLKGSQRVVGAEED